MLEPRLRQVHPELRGLVVEASRALARLDAERLEELALSCRALNRDLARDLEGIDAAERRSRTLQARAALPDMAIFGRVLEATAENVAVMRRIREVRRGRQLEYGNGRDLRGNGHGDH